jgi:hypothetical protein
MIAAAAASPAHLRKARRAAVPLPVFALLIAFLCPVELSLDVAGLRIPPHRLALLLLTPLALWRAATSPSIRLRGFDYVFVLFHVLTVAVFMIHEGYHEGMVYGGSLALEGLGAYLVARVWIRDVETFDATLRGFAVAVAVAALIALPETLFGQLFTHDFLRQVTGYVHPTGVESRLGLTRAYGVFDHPIHYGTFCAALLAVFWTAARTRQQRYRRTALLCGATFLGLSSAPMLCLMFQAGLLIWERMTRGMVHRTTLTLAALTGLYIGASLVMTRSPINLIATGMTLDSWTGFYRLQIWEHGLANVFANPLIGIGLGDWERPWWMVSSTVDAFWLVVAMRQGLPVLFLLVLALGLLVRAVVKRGLHQPDPRVRRLARGWIISLIALSLVGVTVHFWNVLYTFYFFFVGLAGWMADPRRVRKAAIRHRPPATVAQQSGYYPVLMPGRSQSPGRLVTAAPAQ